MKRKNCASTSKRRCIGVRSHNRISVKTTNTYSFTNTLMVYNVLLIKNVTRVKVKNSRQISFPFQWCQTGWLWSLQIVSTLEITTFRSFTPPLNEHFHAMIKMTARSCQTLTLTHYMNAFGSKRETIFWLGLVLESQCCEMCHVYYDRVFLLLADDVIPISINIATHLLLMKYVNETDLKQITCLPVRFNN